MIKIGIIKGDGIGPEIVEQAVQVLNAVSQKFGFSIEYEQISAGGCSIDVYGSPLTDEAVAQAKSCGGVLLGAVGGPKWDDLPGDKRPEKGLLRLRKELGLFANIRPAKLFAQLVQSCPLKDEIAARGIDFVIVRELVSGIYFGERGQYVKDGSPACYDVESYSEHEIRRVSQTAFALARTRRKKVTLVDKANVLETSRLWRKVVPTVQEQYPDVSLDFMFVDNAAMQIIKNPAQFDVVLTSNMFGDILSDEASMITGSIGMIASSSLAEQSPGLYEPIHGSAPDIAGQNLANPIATILSAAMMLETDFKMPAASQAIAQAVDQVLADGYRTPDILTPGCKQVSCSQMGSLIAGYIKDQK